MARISNKPTDELVSGSDRLLGTDANDSNQTKNYTIDSIAAYMGSFAEGYPTLQQVTSEGKITTDNIIINKDLTATSGVDIALSLDTGTTASGAFNYGFKLFNNTYRR